MNPLVAGLLGAAPGIAKSIFGVGQGLRARDLAKMERPTMPMPSGMEELLANARMMAGLRELPGQGRMEQKIASSTAGALSQAKELSDSPATTLGALADVYGQQMGNYADLEQAAAQYWAGNQQQLQGALGQYANWQDKLWQWNEGMPYLQQMDAARRLNESYPINLFTGLAEGIGGGLMGYGGQELQNTFGDLLKELKGYWGNLPGGDGTNSDEDNSLTKALMLGAGMMGKGSNSFFNIY